MIHGQHVVVASVLYWGQLVASDLYWGQPVASFSTGDSRLLVSLLGTAGW